MHNLVADSVTALNVAVALLGDMVSDVAESLDADNARIWREHAAPLRAAYFDPLCSRLGLIKAPDGLLAAHGHVSATGGDLRVYFENDRGLCYFALGPATEERSLWGVDEIARLFPRIRLTGGGTQRLSLEEQANFIASTWTALQWMFSPAHIEETRRALHDSDRP